MKWSAEAEKTMRRVPFFIRKMVRKKVEAYAASAGAEIILNEHIEACKKQYMKQMDRDLRGYSVETCLGAQECSNRTLGQTNIADEIEEFLKGQKMKEFLQERLGRPLKVHNEFRVSISFCPNSCSRPQIVDVGLIGAVVVEPSEQDDTCNGCGACAKVCKEDAIVLDGSDVKILRERCLYCGHCERVCPKSAISRVDEGFRILVGGKLGRHPQLGMELPRIYAPEDALLVVKEVVRFFKKECKKGERLGEIVSSMGFEAFLQQLNLP
ncbi:MAG: 4Fe-4S dicluster domain-containing protein [Thermodesulfobacteria bacterium]|nr:4Fe-4S dicluster domain-containing protein [Thermodesulfobacteriota bacterium]